MNARNSIIRQACLEYLSRNLAKELSDQVRRSMDESLSSHCNYQMHRDVPNWYQNRIDELNGIPATRTEDGGVIVFVRQAYQDFLIELYKVPKIGINLMYVIQSKIRNKLKQDKKIRRLIIGTSFVKDDRVKAFILASDLKQQVNQIDFDSVNKYSLEIV